MHNRNWLVILLLFGLLACGEKPEKKGVKQAINSKKQVEEPKQQPNASKGLSMDSSITVAYIMGKFDPAQDDRFVEINIQYASREGMLLREEAYEAFKRMYEAAKNEGVSLKILSATRNFDYQKGIWERKWTGQRILSNGKNAAQAYPDPKDRALKILEYSAMPGISRHHWGTDIDLNAFNNSYFERGEGAKIYQWLVANAPSFGFCQPYTPKGPDRPNGYNEEKWHWSYMPISQPLTRGARELLKDGMIKGFKGDEVCEPIGMVENYVLGISEDCL